MASTKLASSDTCSQGSEPVIRIAVNSGPRAVLCRRCFSLLAIGSVAFISLGREFMPTLDRRATRDARALRVPFCFGLSNRCRCSLP